MSLALDVGIGLIFLYLLLALLVTTLQELIATMFRLRAKQLFDAIQGMFRDDGAAKLVQKLYAHPLIKNLSEAGARVGLEARQSLLGTGLPSYIPSKTFAIALLDVLKGEKPSAVTGADDALANLRALIASIDSPTVKQTLGLLLEDAERIEQDVNKRAKVFSDHVEGWFNDRMARASGWYKRKAQAISFALALAVSVVCNASTFKVADRLWHDSSLRAAVAASAQAFKDTNAGGLVESNLPIGWHGYTAAGDDLLLIPLGWLTTALAVSLGSGFWFNLLGQALRIRGTGTRVSSADGKVQADEG